MLFTYRVMCMRCWRTCADGPHVRDLKPDTIAAIDKANAAYAAWRDVEGAHTAYWNDHRQFGEAVRALEDKALEGDTAEFFAALRKWKQHLLRPYPASGHLALEAWRDARRAASTLVARDVGLKDHTE